MGSLFSKPDIPNQYSYAQAYTPPSVAGSGGSDAATGDSTTPSSDGSSADNAARVASILRNRSFPDTIQTSWRGVLQPGDWVPQRKSLLGE